jgi:hypothetical protein
MRTRSGRRKERKDLWRKITFLRDRTPEAGGGAAGTWEAFTAFTTISRGTLKDGGGAITDANEQILGQRYGFDPFCPTWTHGSCDDWTGKWFPKPASPNAPRLRAVPIAERIGSFDPEQRLAVTLFMRRQEADPSNQAFDAELVCQVFEHIGVRLAVRRGLLKVMCREDLVPPITARLGAENGGAIQFERKGNTITVTPGGRDHMNWEIEADRAPIGVVSQQLVELFRIGGLRDGDVLEIIFLVTHADLVAAEVDENGAAAEALSDGDAADSAVVVVGGASLGRSKRTLMAHIAKHSMGLFGEQRRGTAVLCRYAIRIEADKRPGGCGATEGNKQDE